MAGVLYRIVFNLGKPDAMYLCTCQEERGKTAPSTNSFRALSYSIKHFVNVSTLLPVFDQVFDFETDIADIYLTPSQVFSSPLFS